MGKLLRVRSRGTGGLGVAGVVALAAGCNSDYFIDSVPPAPPPQASGAVGGTGAAGGGPGISKGSPGKGGGTPMDMRPVVTPARQPPAVSGGTLLALREGGRAVVADADRDRLVFVDLENQWVEATLDLGAGSEPGRVVEGDGEVHVVLRGTGEVLTVSLATHAAVSRRAVCRAPRGLVFDGEQDTLLVACLEGRLVELPASEGAILRDVPSETDLRDLVRSNERLLATRFRSAEVLELDEELAVAKRYTLGQSGTFSPSVAWRAVAGPDGSIVVSHQRGTSARISLADDPVDTGAGGAPGEDGSAGAGTAGEFGGSSSSTTGYGSPSDPCAGIVGSAVSTLTSSGTVVRSGKLAGSVLPVDVATGPGGVVAVVNAGVRDFSQDNAFSASSFSASIQVFLPQTLDQSLTGGCVQADVLVDVGSPAVGVAFDPKLGVLLVQRRDPATIALYDQSFVLSREIALGGTSVIETGHEIFHRDSGGGIACASCHPEGTDDGRVWNFARIGARRTQPLDVKLEGSAPFHWDAEFPDLQSLVGDVLVSRMGGAPQAPERVAALERFLYQLRPRPGVRADDDPAALRGKKLFDSERTGCTECHRGHTFSTFETAEIGKGAATQIPSLIGVSTRTPLMHDGCADTLYDRFDPECGGSEHGSFEDLTKTELDDLVAYLETL